MYQNSTIIPLLNARGQVENICLIIYDVTDTAVNKMAQQQANKLLKEVSRTDPLTQLNNRGYWEKCLIDAFKKHQRYQTTCSLIMLDIDHFKRVNDNYGHTVGDEVIRRVSTEIKEQIRDLDIAGRYGGEEFGIILTGTDGPSAAHVAERLRASIESLEVQLDSEMIKFTVSLGIHQVNSSINSHTQWMEKADKALYQSKENGRNQVTLLE